MPNYYPTDFDRLLPDRANVEFWYPDKANTIMTLPFFENPKISESATASYVEYNPLARSSSLFVYTGAKSRRFRVEAKYTLPDLMTYPMGIARYKRIFEGSDEGTQRDYFSFGTKEQLDVNRASLSSIASEARKFYFENSFEAGTNQIANELFNQQGNPELTDQEYADVNDQIVSTFEYNDALKASFLNNPSFDRAIDTMMFFIAILRSSILNNADNPVQGPPLARLNFGVLHDSVPCIVKGYTIDWEEKAGYDLQTLTPRRLVITMDMQEVRVGDFGKFVRTSMIEKDNLAGWESVIGTPHSISPGQS